MTVTLVGEGGPEELRGLAAELGREARLHGRLELVERPPDPGTLGPILEALRVVAEPGVMSVVVGAVATWLRYHTSDVDVKVMRTDRSTTVSLSGRRMRALESAALNEQVIRLAQELEGRSAWPAEDKGGQTGRPE